LSGKGERRGKKYRIFWSDIKGEIRGRKRAREKTGKGIRWRIIEENFELEDTLKFDYNSLKFERTDAEAGR